MTKILAATALAIVVAAPAFAQSYDPDLGTGNVILAEVAPLVTYGVTNRPTGNIGAQVAPAVMTGGTNLNRSERAFARVAPADFASGTSLQSPNGVYDAEGRLIGADPDPNVRLQLQKDHDEIE
jgi:hypothetical protein